MISLIKFFIKRMLGYFMYFISGFIPRNKKIWVFGSFDGVFKDNSCYLYQYVVGNQKNQIRAIWISKDVQSVKEARFYGEAYTKYSIQGLYYSLLAKVYVCSGGIQDINIFTSRKCVTLNLWHGIPIKKIGFDAVTSVHLRRYFKKPDNLLEDVVMRFRYPTVYMRYDFVLSPSKFVADYALKSAFRISDKNIVIAEYPRVSYLKQCQPLTEYENYNKIFLYAPTWRDDDRDFLKQAQFDFERLDSLMQQKNALFLIKLHSATKININLSLYENLKLLPNDIDPIALMKTADCLITDYSSIYLDYLVLDRPIIHFCFDLEEYIKTSREFYFEYDDVLGGVKAINFNELYCAIMEIFQVNDLGSIQRNELSSKFLNSNDDSSLKIVQTIKNHIGF